MIDIVPADKCVIRLCRCCGFPTSLREYESDLEFRWYHFFCEICGFRVTIGESINKMARELKERDGCEFEPLVPEEEFQDEDLRELEKRRRWRFYRSPDESRDSEFR